MVLSAWPLVFWLVGFLDGWFLLQAFCCLFFPLYGSFSYTPREPCSLLFNILFLSIKKKKGNTGREYMPYDVHIKRKEEEGKWILRK